MDSIELKLMMTQNDMKYTHSVFQAYILQTEQESKQRKQRTKEIFNKMLQNLEDSKSPLKSKFYTIMILRQFSLEKNSKVSKNIFSIFSGHTLWPYLLNLAKIIDPQKPVELKGKQSSQFKRDPQAGNDFIRIILEFIMYLGKTYEKKKDNKPTKFKVGYDNLTTQKVVFPQQSIYFGRSHKKQLQSQNPKNKINIEMALTKNKVDTLLTKFQDAKNVNQLQNDIEEYHKDFKLEQEKYKKYQQKIITQGYTPETIENFFNINIFLNKQDEYYKQYIPRDYYSYIEKVKIIGQNLSNQQNKQKTGKVSSKRQQSNINQVKYQRGDRTAKIQQQLNRMQRTIQNKSKSPGFKSIKQSLNQEKKNIKVNPPRAPRKRSLSPLNKSISGSISPSRSGLHRQSRIMQIFLNPPNDKIPTKVYQGKLAVENHDLNNILYQIKKDQGIRRFKMSNFKSKNPLFENNQIQIGYKSDLLFQKIENIQALISFQLFIGNKTDNQIRNFKLQYKGDQNQLLYAHPRVLDSVIPSGFQIKHQLMIGPINIPFQFIYAKISYEYQGDHYHTSVALPNSILKLTKYYFNTKNQFLSDWRSSAIYKTVPFKLSHHLPPDSFQKLIPPLEQFTRYTDFVTPGSTIDYQLGCYIQIIGKHKGMIKINIRPNLDVVLQIGINSRQDESETYLKFYLQTLQFLLNHTEI